MVAPIRWKFEHGRLIPLNPVPPLKEGDIIEFLLPDPNPVYLCESDKLAALENGQVVWTPATDEGAEAHHD